MDWNIVYSRGGSIVGGFAVIMISYYLPKSLLRRDRKAKKEKATTIDIVWASLVTLGCCALFAGFFSYEMPSSLTYFIIWFPVAAIPATLSLITYFKKDARMSITDRIADQIIMDKEEQEASRYETEY